MQTILNSVGRSGKNNSADVKVVQQLLNQHPMPPHTTPLQVDGLVGPQTISRIEAFQKDIVGMVHPDGRVDPNGGTMTALAKDSTSPDQGEHTHQLSTKGENLLKSIEQLSLQPYDDQTGKKITAWVKGATIGYGHLISTSEWDTYKNGINMTQADELFRKDLLPFANAVNEKVTSDLSQHQFDALVILTFNIGISAFGTSSVLKLVNDPAATTSYPDLESAWKAWNKSQGKVMQGLMNRRNAEWNIYSQNIYKTW